MSDSNKLIIQRLTFNYFIVSNLFPTDLCHLSAFWGFIVVAFFFGPRSIHIFLYTSGSLKHNEDKCLETVFNSIEVTFHSGLCHVHKLNTCPLGAFWGAYLAKRMGESLVICKTCLRISCFLGRKPVKMLKYLLVIFCWSLCAPIDGCGRLL